MIYSLLIDVIVCFYCIVQLIFKIICLSLGKGALSGPTQLGSTITYVCDQISQSPSLTLIGESAATGPDVHAGCGIRSRNKRPLAGCISVGIEDVRLGFRKKKVVHGKKSSLWGKSRRLEGNDGTRKRSGEEKEGGERKRRRGGKKREGRKRERERAWNSVLRISKAFSRNSPSSGRRSVVVASLPHYPSNGGGLPRNLVHVAACCSPGLYHTHARPLLSFQPLHTQFVSSGFKSRVETGLWWFGECVCSGQVIREWSLGRVDSEKKAYKYLGREGVYERI
ncbi:uncharacterized protein [Physcomitrium patens]|uniref:uncharacterized protein n=1 Tax=Physcomitrium patens TaxID=3218 RepID=UPI003CCD5257